MFFSFEASRYTRSPVAVAPLDDLGEQCRPDSLTLPLRVGPEYLKVPMWLAGMVSIEVHEPGRTAEEPLTQKARHGPSHLGIGAPSHRKSARGIPDGRTLKRLGRIHLSERQSGPDKCVKQSRQAALANAGLWEHPGHERIVVKGSRQYPGQLLDVVEARLSNLDSS